MPLLPKTSSPTVTPPPKHTSRSWSYPGFFITRAPISSPLRSLEYANLPYCPLPHRRIAPQGNQPRTDVGGTHVTGPRLHVRACAARRSPRRYGSRAYIFSPFINGGFWHCPGRGG